MGSNFVLLRFVRFAAFFAYSIYISLLDLGQLQRVFVAFSRLPNEQSRLSSENNEQKNILSMRTKTCY